MSTNNTGLPQGDCLGSSTRGEEQDCRRPPATDSPRVLGCRVKMIPPSLLHGYRTELRAGRPRKESGQEQHKEAEYGETCSEGLEEKDGDSLHSV